ncbi:MAG TPA: hypothetical protein VKF62_01885 [Planctomycetota bacterium]|nr:hypothetical protein [Planctomycetota bacterium]
MLMQLAASFLVASPDPPSATFEPVIEWCSRGSYWSATEVVTGGYAWSMEASLDYVPSPRRIYVSGNLTNLIVGYQISLYLPLNYPCVDFDPSASMPIVNWVDPALGWLHASILKPPGIPWPEAIEAGAVVLVIQ